MPKPASGRIEPPPALRGFYETRRHDSNSRSRARVECEGGSVLLIMVLRSLKVRGRGERAGGVCRCLLLICWGRRWGSKRLVRVIITVRLVDTFRAMSNTRRRSYGVDSRVSRIGRLLDKAPTGTSAPVHMHLHLLTLSICISVDPVVLQVARGDGVRVVVRVFVR